MLERTATFLAGTLGTELATALGNGQLHYLRLVGRRPCGRTVKASVARIEIQALAEPRLMRVQRWLDLLAIDRVAVEHTVVGNEPAAALGKNYLVADSTGLRASPHLIRSVCGSKME